MRTLDWMFCGLWFLTGCEAPSPAHGPNDLGSSYTRPDHSLDHTVGEGGACSSSLDCKDPLLCDQEGSASVCRDPNKLYAGCVNLGGADKSNCFCDLEMTLGDFIAYGCKAPALTIGTLRGVCCADLTWPSKGSCWCETDRWLCTNYPGDSCSCDWQQVDTGQTSVSCNQNSGTSEPRTCCLSPSGACTCWDNAVYGTTCSTGTTMVTSCSAQASNSAPNCSSAFVATNQCKTGPQPPPPSMVTPPSSSGGGSGGSTCDPSTCNGTQSSCTPDGSCFYCTYSCSSGICSSTCS